LTGKVTGDAKKTGNGSKEEQECQRAGRLPGHSDEWGRRRRRGHVHDPQSRARTDHAELLGLTLTTNTIRIRLTGETNSLLGGLLCGLVGAPLINLGDLVAVVGLLNQILAILG
jgi:hypothetical protein